MDSVVGIKPISPLGPKMRCGVRLSIAGTQGEPWLRWCTGGTSRNLRRLRFAIGYELARGEFFARNSDGSGELDFWIFENTHCLTVEKNAR